MVTDAVNIKDNYVVECHCCLQGGEAGLYPVTLPPYKLDYEGRRMTALALIGHAEVFHGGDMNELALALRTYGTGEYLVVDVFEVLGLTE